MAPEDAQNQPAAKSEAEPEETPEEEAEGQMEEETGEEAAPEGATQETAPTPGGQQVDEEEAKAHSIEERRDPLRVIEAALFVGNRKMAVAELALVARTTVRNAANLLQRLKKELDDRGSAVELVVENGLASLEVRPAYVGAIAGLSKDTGLTRKSTRILGLIAKKGEMLQSELKNYFKGEIYAYTTELKEAGYVTAEKKGNTRLLKPTKKFTESFQLGA